MNARSEHLMQHATQTIEVGSKSFAAAARLFPPSTRRSVLMLYAWCRHCDDAVDGQELGFAKAPMARDAGAELDRLYDATRRAYAGETMRDPAFAAFQEVALGHGLAPRYAFDHLAGFAMDVAETRYDTIEDTLRYCYHVAGVVGLMMASIMGARDETVLDRACDLGMAFQLTNIARDIVDDAAIGRCYVPAQWLVDAGIPPDHVALPRHREALARVAARLVDYAEPYYESAAVGIADLPLRSAWAIATARNVYRQIGIEVKRRGARAWDERVGTSKAAKLRLLALGGLQALGSRFRRRRAGSVPAALTQGVRQPARQGLWPRPGRAGGAAPGATLATDV